MRREERFFDGLRRQKRCFIVISPHQDDEWLGCYQMLLSRSQRLWKKAVIYITESLYPDLREYTTRRTESQKACNYFGATYHALGLKEEQLFKKPYNQQTYIPNLGNSFQGKLLKQIKKIQGTKDLYLAFPSSTDAEGHVVHKFARDLTLNIISSLNPRKLIQYTIYSTEHPSNSRIIRVKNTLKYYNFKRFYPTQWSVIEKDPWALQVVQWHCNFEYMEATT